MLTKFLLQKDSVAMSMQHLISCCLPLSSAVISAQAFISRHITFSCCLCWRGLSCSYVFMQLCFQSPAVISKVLHTSLRWGQLTNLCTAPHCISQCCSVPGPKHQSKLGGECLQVSYVVTGDKQVPPEGVSEHLHNISALNCPEAA